MSERVDTQQSDDKHEVPERDSDATSRETLKDLEENQENIASNRPAPEPGPSPDGDLDEPGDTKDADPI